MAEGLNRVMLLGSLGADPELRYAQSGTAVLKIRLATNESYLDKDKVRRERADWHTVVLFGSRAEALGKILAKGSTIFVEGSIRTSSYEKDGKKVYKTEIHAQNVILGGRPNRGGAGGEGGQDDGQGGGYGGGAPQGGHDDFGPGGGAQSGPAGGDDIPY